MTKDATLPEPLGTTVADQSLRVATALSAEVIVLRERLALIEMLAAERGLFGPGEIDAYRPLSEAAEMLKGKRLSFIERVFGGLRG